jgi:hypothetical protein
MALYYNGNLEEDLAELKEESAAADLLDAIGKQIGYGHAQQILQVLWAKHLREQGIPTNGALFR